MYLIFYSIVDDNVAARTAAVAAAVAAAILFS
jgi:hypothetical protein